MTPDRLSISHPALPITTSNSSKCYLFACDVVEHLLGIYKMYTLMLFISFSGLHHETVRVRPGLSSVHNRNRCCDSLA